jgi:polyhydroxyalkanoate synthesis regulator phasin
MLIAEIIKKAMLVGLGAQEKAKEFVEELVKAGELSKSEASSLVKEWTSKAEESTKEFDKRVKETVSNVLEKLNIPTREDMAVLPRNRQSGDPSCPSWGSGDVTTGTSPVSGISCLLHHATGSGILSSRPGSSASFPSGGAWSLSENNRRSANGSTLRNGSGSCSRNWAPRSSSWGRSSHAGPISFLLSMRKNCQN